MATARLVFASGKVESRDIAVNGEVALLAREAVPAGVACVEFWPDLFAARAGDDGFYVVPGVEPAGHAALTVFRDRSDRETAFRDSPMPIFAACRNGRAGLAVVTGMRFEYELVVGVRDGGYYLYPRFLLGGERPYEDLSLRLLEADAAGGYSALARCYRHYQLERGACVPLAERRRKHPVAGLAAEGPEVRIRMAWKPVPPPVLEQTEENEPPVHAAVTFEQAERIVDEFHRQGIDRAEFCLVGWNRGGHDGRFPDILPAEPALGGDEGLARLVERAEKFGYLICGHTNVLDSYTVAKRWRREDMLKDADGELVKGGRWGGGQSYFACPRAAHENLVPRDMEDMRRIGFRGTHYLDVMSIIPPAPCHDPAHPLTRAEAAEWRARTLAAAREAVGASASEGAWDFCAGSMDYVLYTVFHMDYPMPDVCDRYVPFWHLVYHGILHYNTFCETVNAAIKSDPTLALKNIEYGGRPLSYFHAKFLSSGRNWMGEEDLTFRDEDELRAHVAKIKKDYERFKTIRDLQFVFFEEHAEPAPGVVRNRYSDGSLLYINYNDADARIDGHVVPAKDFIRRGGAAEARQPDDRV